MQPQHSCGTLESRNKMFGCLAREVSTTFYPLGHYSLLQGACVHTKGV